MGKIFDYVLGLAKHWLTSKTVWGVAILLFGAHLHVIGLNLQQGDAGALADMFRQLTDALGNGFSPDQLATTLGKTGESIGTMLAFYGRHKADGPLPVTPKQVEAARVAMPPPTP